MDLSLTPEQAAYKAEARDWLADNFAEHWKGVDRRDIAESLEGVAKLRDWDRRLHQAGYAGISWPKAYGGSGRPLIDQFIFAEELGKCAVPDSINVVGIELVAPIVLGAGTEEQKKEIIPKILSSEQVWCQGFSEPNAGSDLASVRTSAVLEGGEWVINGQKIWTSQGRFADYCVVLARTDPATLKHLGLSLLIVPMDAPGLNVAPLVQMTGRRNFSQVFFDDVRIPATSYIGPLHSGWKVANSILSTERGTMRLYRQTRMLGDFDRLLELARTRHGKGFLTNEGSYAAQKLAETYGELAILRWHTMKLLSRIIGGQKPGAETSINKIFWSELCQGMASLGVEMLGSGAIGLSDHELLSGWPQDMYLQSRSASIASGTTQIQLNIIAERTLGLPR